MVMLDQPEAGIGEFFFPLHDDAYSVFMALPPHTTVSGLLSRENLRG
jgi:hypothetical protein